MEIIHFSDYRLIPLVTFNETSFKQRVEEIKREYYPTRFKDMPRSPLPPSHPTSPISKPRIRGKAAKMARQLKIDVSTVKMMKSSKKATISKSIICEDNQGFTYIDYPFE